MGKGKGNEARNEWGRGGKNARGQEATDAVSSPAGTHWGHGVTLVDGTDSAQTGVIAPWA